MIRAGVTLIGLFAASTLYPFVGELLARDHGVMGQTWGIAEPDLLATIGDWHIASVWALLALIGLHVCAALYHQVILKDGTLTRMLPSSNR